MGGLQLPPPQGTWCPRSVGDLAGAGQPWWGWGCGGRHLQQGQPDGVKTPPPCRPSVSEPVAGPASGEAPKSLPEALGRQGDRRVPPEAQVEQAAAPPQEHPVEHRTQFSGNLGPGLPQRDMPTPGANLILGQTGLSRALGAHDPPCRVSEECLPGLLSMGQPSRWTRSDNTPPSAIRGLEVWVPPLCPPRGKELSPRVSPRNTDIKTGTGPRLANRAAGRAGAWDGHEAGQRRLGLHTRWPAAGPVWTEAGRPGSRCPQLHQA